MLKQAFVAAGIAAIAMATTAHADVLSTSGALTIWSANTPGAVQSDQSQAGIRTNPISTNGNKVFSGTYSGPINFNLPSGTDTISNFLNTSPGFTESGTSFNGGLSNTLSNGSFAHVSLFDFVITTGAATNYTVLHDDGFSIFNAANSGPAIFDASAPTTATPTAVSLAANTTYNLWYAEANGLPADLVITFVPEPMSLSLLGAGLVGIGLASRRGKARAA